MRRGEASRIVSLEAIDEKVMEDTARDFFNGLGNDETRNRFHAIAEAHNKAGTISYWMAMYGIASYCTQNSGSFSPGQLMELRMKISDGAIYLAGRPVVNPCGGDFKPQVPIGTRRLYGRKTRIPLR